MEVIDRITIDHRVFGRKPCIRGLLFPVSKVLDLIAAGMSNEEILKDYPYLDAEDIPQALKYAAGVIPGRAGGDQLKGREEANRGRTQTLQVVREYGAY